MVESCTIFVEVWPCHPTGGERGLPGRWAGRMPALPKKNGHLLLVPAASLPPVSRIHQRRKIPPPGFHDSPINFLLNDARLCISFDQYLPLGIDYSALSEILEFWIG